MNFNPETLVLIVIVAFAVFCFSALGMFIFARKLQRALRFQSGMLEAIARELTGHNEMLSLSINNFREMKDEFKWFTRLLMPSNGRVLNAVLRPGKPSDIVLSDSDTYDRLDQNWMSVRDTADRQETSTSIVEDRRRTAVVVILGQSNAANHGAGRYSAKHRVDNFNIYDGKCYRAQDPLLGASGDGGNFATRFGDKLIEAGLFDRVILAPIGMGGTAVEQWAEEGMFNRRIPVLIRRLYDAGLDADFILWHQGEGNSGIGDVNGRQYRKNLLEVIQTFRTYGIEAPFFVALATLCNAPHPNAENIRGGQKSTVTPALGIHLGADTDIIGLEHRWDKCHFDERGLDLAALLWLKVIEDYLNANRSALRESAKDATAETTVHH